VDNGSAQGPAATAIRTMGASTLPYIIAELEANDSVLKKKLMDLAGRQSVFKLHFTPDRIRRARGVKACALLGPSAEPAIPALGVALGKGESGAATLLEKFGSKSVQALASALTNAPGCAPPYYTAQVLGRMSANARTAMTNLAWNFQYNPIGAPRGAAGRAMAEISLALIEKEHEPECREVMMAKTVLLRGLSETNHYLAAAAASSLGLLKHHAKEAVPALIKLRQTGDEFAQQAAAKALQAIESEPTAEPVVANP
jgi:hypothetical protein